MSGMRVDDCALPDLPVYVPAGVTIIPVSYDFMLWLKGAVASAESIT